MSLRRSSRLQASLMHLVPFADCRDNPDGGSDLIQAGPRVRLNQWGQLHQNCGIAVAVASPLNAEVLWCKFVVTLAHEEVNTIIRELRPGENQCARHSYADTDLWCWSQSINWNAMKSGLYYFDIRISTTRESFSESHGTSSLYIEPPA